MRNRNGGVASINGMGQSGLDCRHGEKIAGGSWWGGVSCAESVHGWIDQQGSQRHPDGHCEEAALRRLGLADSAGKSCGLVAYSGIRGSRPVGRFKSKRLAASRLRFPNTSTRRRPKRKWMPSHDAFVGEALTAVRHGPTRQPSDWGYNQRSVVAAVPARNLYDPLQHVSYRLYASIPFYGPSMVLRAESTISGAVTGSVPQYLLDSRGQHVVRFRRLLQMSLATYSELRGFLVALQHLEDGEGESTLHELAFCLSKYDEGCHTLNGCSKTYLAHPKYRKVCQTCA